MKSMALVRLRQILVLWGCALLASASLGALLATPEEGLLGSVRFEITLKSESASPLKGSLILRPTSEQGEEIVIPVESAAPASVSARLPAGTTWEVTIDIPGFWGPRTPLTVGDPSIQTVHPIGLWPMGRVSGRVKVQEKDAHPPKQVTVTTLAAPGHLKRPEAPKGSLECPVDDKGEWTCSLPAAELDLVIAAEGFIPHYRWGVRIPADKPLSLGTLELRRGASVAGWVAVEAGRIDPDSCVARLFPFVAEGSPLAAAAQLGRTAFEAKVGRDGFFQLTGLPSGTYILEVRQAPYAPARVSPVQVRPKAETFLREPIHLEHPLQIEISISPPLDWLGKPWRLRISRLSDSGSRSGYASHERSGGPEGRVVVPDQTPGRFSLTVWDSLGNELFAESDWHVDGSEEARRSIDIELLTLQGEISLGEEPLAARLRFTGPAGKAHMESSTEGRFHGVLPRGGRWWVEIASSEPAIETRARVDVQPDGAGRARVEISLPDTRVFGRVVDPKGQPVPKAEVTFLSEQTTHITSADGKGTFEARALPEGLLRLGAQDSGRSGPKRTSGIAQVHLLEGQDVGPVELRLRQTKELTGQVLSPLGPVAGARLAILARHPTPDAVVSAASDLQGRFNAEIPDNAERAVIVVGPPGHALKAFDVPAVGGEAVVLQVSEEAGVLEISLPYSSETMYDAGHSLELFQNDLPLPSFVVRDWVRGQGEKIPKSTADVLRIPNVSPGGYRACIAAHCGVGVLTAGATLRLELTADD